MHEILKKSKIDFKILNLEIDKFSSQIKKINEENKEVTNNQKSNMSNIHQSLLHSRENSEDLIYFVEDDYIHEKSSIKEILYTAIIRLFLQLFFLLVKFQFFHAQ